MRHPLLERCWIQSFTGKRVDLLNMKPEQVCIEDIAHALANKGRYTGHAKFFYSVGQHTILGAAALPSAFKLAFLLHELSEVYLPDIAGPLKPFVYVQFDALDDTTRCITWEQLEREHTSVMLRALGLSSLEPLIYSPEVRTMDLRMLMTEKTGIHGPEPEPWGDLAERFPALPGVFIDPIDNTTIKRMWLDAFQELTS